jgi:Cellulose binding domain./Glycosyl hydrolases family 11.
MSDRPIPDTAAPRRRRRIRTLTAVGLTGAVAAIVAVTFTTNATAAVTSNQTGTHDGYFYSFWTDAPGTVSVGLGPGGNYSIQWNNTGSFIAGKGWSPGSPQTVTYTGSFTPIGNAYLGLYGWTTNPPVEYFIVDSWGTWRPPGAQPLGTVTSDGGTYEIYRTQRPRGLGIIQAAEQFWSVRTAKRVGGTITVTNHVNAWAAHGMNLGTHNYTIMAVEGYQGSGYANITIVSSSPGGGSCTVSVSRGQEWNDRFNVNFSVSGSNNWVVTINLGPGQSIQNSWNTTLSGGSGTIQARPNGNGNNFGITVWRNGNNNTPTATCAVG